MAVPKNKPNQWISLDDESEKWPLQERQHAHSLLGPRIKKEVAPICGFLESLK
jgi:hypothetical protein